MKYKGFDISQWQGNCDLAAAKKSGMDFVIVRSSYGNVAAYPWQRDTQFNNNANKAKKAGIPFGVYHYSYATTADGMIAEAKGFVKLLNEIKPVPYFVALDIEEKTQYNLSQSQLEAITKAFIDVVEQAGYFCALYSYECFLRKYSADFRKKYAIWCANTGGTPGIGFGVHQYSFTGRVSGIAGDVDMNASDTDYVSIIAKAGLNGVKKPETKAETKAEPKAPVKGDLNDDGRVDVTDVAMLAAHVKGEKKLD